MRKLLTLAFVLVLGSGAPAALVDESFAAGKTVRLKSVNSLSTAQRTRIAKGLGKLAPRTRPPGPIKDAELNLMCGIEDWFFYYEEDENGNPVTGTCNISCDGTLIPFC